MFGLGIASIALLAAAGILAGAVNAMAGGGSLFTFLALAATGLPPIVANATSAVAVIPANFASAVAYRHELSASFRRLLFPGVAAAVGGLFGGIILVQIGNDAFRSLVPWLLLGATLILALGPTFLKRIQQHRPEHSQGHANRIVASFSQFLVSSYGGFFGTGMGILMLASLSLTEREGFHRINAAKNAFAVLTQFTAVCLFIHYGLVSWAEAVIVTVTGIVGGWFGVIAGRKIPEGAIRALIVVGAIALTGWVFWKQYVVE